MIRAGEEGRDSWADAELGLLGALWPCRTLWEAFCTVVCSKAVSFLSRS